MHSAAWNIDHDVHLHEVLFLLHILGIMHVEHTERITAIYTTSKRKTVPHLLS